MPIITIDDQRVGASTSEPDALARIQQHERDIAMYGDPWTAAPRPAESPSFWRTWVARSQNSFVQDLFDNFATDRGPSDPSFNPYTFIRESPELDQDWRVKAMVDMRQFDGSQSEEQFWRDHERGERYLDNLGVLHRTSNWSAFTTFVGAALGDPLNVVPLGFGAKVMNQGRLASQMAKVAGLAAVTNVGIEELSNTLNPMTEAPGISNELTAALLGSAIAGGSKFVLSGVGRALTEADRMMMGRRAQAMVREAVGAASAEEFRSGTRSPLAGTPFEPDELFRHDMAAAKAELEAMLRETPADHATVRALHRPGDEVAVLLGQLKARYAEAGKTLTVLEHDNQQLLDLFETAKAIGSEVNNLAAASASDLGQGASSVVGAPIAALERLQRFATPGGRLHTIAQGDARLAAAVRTLSGSEQTVTKASAADPVGHRAPVSAESLKDLFAGYVTTARAELVDSWRDARTAKEALIDVDGAPIRSRREFMRAVGRLAAAEEDAANLPWIPTPANIHPSLRKGLDALRRYTRLMGDEAEAAGLPGSGRAALGDAERAVADLRTALANATDPDKSVKLSVALVKAEARLADLQQVADKRAMYLPRLYTIESLLADAEDFQRRAAESFPLFDEVRDGKRLLPDEVPLIPRVVARLSAADQAALRNALAPNSPANLSAGKVATLEELIDGRLEGDLPESLRALYRQHRSDMYVEGSRTAWNTLTNPRERHGLAEGHDWTDPMSARTMDVAHHTMAPHLVYDAEQLLEHYHRVAAGRIAVRRAISMNGDQWGSAKLADGTPVRTGQDVVRHVLEGFEAQLEMTRAYHVAHGGQDALIAKLEGFIARVGKDLTAGLNRIEGRSIFGDAPSNYFAGANWFANQLKRTTFMNTMGSAALNFLTDLAPATLTAAIGANRFPALMRGLAAGFRGVTARDLRSIGLWMEHESHVHALTDLDAGGNLGQGVGFGSGGVRKLTQFIDRGTEAGSNALTRVGVIRFMQNINKRIASTMLADRVMVLSRRMVRADAALSASKAAGLGSDHAKALRDAGLEAYQAARLNRMGFDLETARAYHRMVYSHGVDETGAKVSTIYRNFEEYLEKANKRIIHNDFDAWPMDPATAEGRAARDLFNRIAAGFASEVHRHLVVTPGAFDKPLINSTALGSIVNQLQSFALAMAGQRLRPMAQMPANVQLWYFGTYLALGAVVDAIQLQLSGRRSFEDTAREWEHNPIGAAYGAFAKTGLLGALQRATGFADAAKWSYAPGVVTGNTISSTASSRAYTPGVANTFGPAADYTSKVWDFLTGHAARGSLPEGAGYRVGKLAPFQNLVWLRLLHQTTDLPVVPEAYRPTR